MRMMRIQAAPRVAVAVVLFAGRDDGRSRSPWTGGREVVERRREMRHWSAFGLVTL